ncbi:MAG: hypothetical protein ACR2QH_15375 [Geminicoccaceae bacterium]
MSTFAVILFVVLFVTALALWLSRRDPLKQALTILTALFSYVLLSSDASGGLFLVVSDWWGLTFGIDVELGGDDEEKAKQLGWLTLVWTFNVAAIVVRDLMSRWIDARRP